MGRIIFKGLRWKAARSVATAGVLVAAVLHPAAATADAILYGLTVSSLSGAHFGTIDPITGNFTAIDTTGLSLHLGHYAPVFDPSRNVFYYTDVPTSSDEGFSGTVNEIDVATGAVTSLNVGGRGVLGVGVGAISATVPEPGSLLQLLTYLLGIAVFTKRRLGSRMRSQEHQPDR